MKVAEDRHAFLLLSWANFLQSLREFLQRNVNTARGHRQTKKERTTEREKRKQEADT